MNRTVGSIVAAGLVLALGGTAQAVFSPATTACISKAQTDYKTCKIMRSPLCLTDYHTAYANCFAAGKGVTCATTCESTRSTCEASALAGQKTCTKGCKPAYVAALAACKPGDLACAVAAKATFKGCRKTCAQQAKPGLGPCVTAFTACIAQCPNL